MGMVQFEKFLELDPMSKSVADIFHAPERAGKYNAKYSKTYNDNNIITFDTETTSFLYNGKKCSFVYIAMISINGYNYYMRDLSLFKSFLDRYDSGNTINVIYVHNLSFDFAFLQNVIPFDLVFARKAHRVIFARYKSWEFRCSYFLSQMSLKNVAKSYHLPSSKLVDGLDYGKIRHTKTPLTKLELKYCELDIIVLSEYVRYIRENNGKYRDIPYTQTGFVRKFTLDYVKQNKSYFAFRGRIKKTLPDKYVFEMLEKCFAGGYTHANYWAVAVGVQTHVKSYDFTSSYPAVMCRCKFPMTPFKKIVTNFKKYIYDDNFCCIGKFRLTNVHAKTNLCYISKHKCDKIVHGVIDNGRIFKADEIIICLTSVDIQTIKMMYDCKIEVLEMYAAGADYLPRDFILSILELYGNKTQYKGIEDMAILYMASKQMVNAEYGMCAFNPFTDMIKYNAGTWELVPPEWSDVEKYYNNRKTILPYAWGVFVTAWARNKLCYMCSKIGNDVLYMDTDSIKYKGNYEKLFEENNKLIHSENVAVSEKLGIPIEKFVPVDKKNCTHELGLWDFEHEYKSFKVLGAKRYCYTLYAADAIKQDKRPDEIYPVVAGCPTDAMRTWLKLHNCNALLDPFRLDLFIPARQSGKSTLTYHENYDIDVPVRDYLGNVNIEHIGFGAHVEPASFDMSLHADYLTFLCGYAVDDKSELTRNGVVI